LRGKVIKQYHGLKSVKESIRLRKLTQNYISALAQAGIAGLPTKVVLAPTKGEKYQLSIVQPFIPEENVLSRYIRETEKGNVLACFRQMVANAKKIREFNAANEKKIGLDPKLSNYAVFEGKVVQIDFFPPQISNTISTTPSDVTRRLRSRTLRVLARLFKKPVERRVREELEKHFDGDFLAKRTLTHFKAARPELKRELEQEYERIKAL